MPVAIYRQAVPVCSGGGVIIPTYDGEDIRRFVEDKRPSLKGKDYQIAFSNQTV